MNNNKKVLLGLVLSILLVLALFVVHPLARNTIIPAKMENKTSGPVATFEVPLMNIITIKVYRSDGRVETYQKIGDPWTQNFMAALANFLFGRYNTNPLPLYARDGNMKTQIETEYVYISGTTYTNNPWLAIGIGSGSTSPSFYDTDLSSPIKIIDVSSSGVSVTDNGTHIIASFTVSYTASSSVTVSEVGLYWYAADYNAAPYRYYLFARDVLSSPISLQANDVLAITYTVTFKYNQPPMTYNFAALMFNYLFGLRYYNKALTFTTTDGTGSSTADFGMDYGDSYGYSYDNIKEYAKIKFGSGTPSYTSRITDVRNTLTTTNSVQVYAGSNSSHFYFTLTVGYPFTSAVTISEVAMIIDSIDIAPSSATNAKQLLVLYFPITNAVNVPAGGAIKFQFTIAFKISP